MNDTQKEVVDELSPADREQLIDALKGWRDAGEENPRIPLEYDADGDGALDAWALEGDELVLVSVDTVEDTVYVSEGDGIEVGGNGGAEEVED